MFKILNPADRGDRGFDDTTSTSSMSEAPPGESDPPTPSHLGTNENLRLRRQPGNSQEGFFLFLE